MQTMSIAHSDLQVTRLAYGCMPLGGSWDDSPLAPETRQEAVRIVQAALDLLPGKIRTGFCRHLAGNSWAASENLPAEQMWHSLCR